MTETMEKTVREIAVECPATVRVFEKLGIDYCCGGRKSLRDACQTADVPFERVIELLKNASQANTGAGSDSWNSAPLEQLTAHIVRKHHGFVRSEVPRLRTLLAKVVARHGSGHPEVSRIQELFDAVAHELSMHMLKEEQVLFPYIETMWAAHLRNEPLPPAFFGTVERPIASMLAEHDDAGAVLAEMRRTSSGYTLPQGACPTFTALYTGLEEFENDLHQHIHLENNILFPRAIEIERNAR
jgi:regulator of cell morphogenesis and NO signaling